MEPRGIRNNNPLNIRVGNAWLGEVEKPTDNQFEQFVSMEFGVRAALMLIKRYIGRYNLNTPRLIISRWAPRSENNTDNYVRIVCQRSGLEPDVSLSYSEKEKIVALVCAMSFIECGVSIDAELVRIVYEKIRWGKYLSTKI